MPSDSPPPSEELSFDVLRRYEKVLDVSELNNEDVELLCRTIRELCAERDARLDEAAQLLAAVILRDAQLSAYITAAEGRPASELMKPSEVERIIEERDDYQKAATAEAHRVDELQNQS